MNVCCVFSLESPHRGDSNEYTQNTIFSVKTKIILNYPKSAAMGFCSKGPKNELEQLKFYCTLHENFIIAFSHTLPKQAPRSILGDHLNSLGNTRVPNAMVKVSMPGNWFWRRRILKVFTICGHDSHVDYMTQIIYTLFRYLGP